MFQHVVHTATHGATLLGAEKGREGEALDSTVRARGPRRAEDVSLRA
jgi:hypothetical protein